MFVQVTAKNVGVFFMRHSVVYITRYVIVVAIFIIY